MISKRNFILSCLSLLLSVSIFSSAKSNISAKADSNNIELSNVQLRGDSSGYFVLVADQFVSKTTSLQVNNLSTYNLKDKVSFYLTNDSDPVKLSTIADDYCVQNIWSQPGLFIKITDNNYNVYNGTTVYKIVIESGCEIPVDGAKYVTSNKFTFLNESYGDNTKKFSAFYFNKIKHQNYVDDTLVSDFVQLRGDPQGVNENFLVIRDKKYLSLTSYSIYPDTEIFDIYSKVVFYMSKDDTTGVSIDEIVDTSANWVINQWTSGGLMLRINSQKYNIYNGTTVYAIKLLQGLSVPCDTKRLILNSDITYFNLGYGDETLKYSSFENQWTTQEPHEPITTDTIVNGVEVRGDSNSSEAFLNIRVSEAEDLDNVSFSVKNQNLDCLDKIIFYENENDKTGTALREIYDAQKDWIINVWNCHGILIPLKYDVFLARFNGSSTYSVEIKKDTLIPFQKDYLLTSVDKYFVNSKFNNDEYTYSGFYFSEMPKELTDFGSVDILAFQNRANDACRWLMVTMSIAFDQHKDLSSIVTLINMLDKILVYFNDNNNPVALRDFYIAPTEIQLFGEPTTLGIVISLSSDYEGPKMFKIKFEKGCQFPYYENGEFGYRTLDEDVILKNDDYGKSGAIFNLFDEYGVERTYEQWNVNWSKATIISFLVEGIDGLSFEPLDCSMGDYVDLSAYEQEGYSLEIYRDNGNKIYQGFYPNKSSITLTLKYTKNTDEQIDKGCSANMSNFSIGIALILSFTSLSFLFIRKREKCYEN